MRKTLVYFLLSALLGTFVLSCDEEDEPTLDVQLIVAPDKLMLSDTAIGKIFLSTKPAQKVDWSIAAKPDWLEIVPATGSTGDQIVELLVKPITTGLQAGMYDGVVEIISNRAGKGVIKVTLAVGTHPKSAVNPTSLDFPAGTTTQMITIRNTGTGFLQWNLTSSVPWVTFSPSTGILNTPAQTAQVQVIVKRSGLAVGNLTGKAILQSNSKGGNIEIPITMAVPQNAILNASADTILFDFFVNEKQFYVKNEGNTRFTWNAAASINNLNITPSSGELAPGDSATMTLKLSRDGLTTGTFRPTLTLSNGQGESKIVQIRVNHFKEEKWLLNSQIVDAEFDRTADVIIAVAENPSRLLKLSPDTRQEVSVTLNLPPTCVSVSPDGKYAAVGHNAKVSYVNLTTMQVDKVYGVTANALDIVLASNKWVYVFPERDQWETIRCINLETGAETQHRGSSIYAGTLGKLHPSGQYIYAADNGLSPSDFEKINLANGTAEYMYDSPYHGNYSFGGNLWISEDGSRLFARSRNVFLASENRTSDMTYSGVLVGSGSVVTLDHSSAAKSVYAVFSAQSSSWQSTPGTEVRVYEAEFLAFQKTLPLPKFLIPTGSGSGKLFNAQGHFGFFNATGKKFYVLVKAAEGAGTLNPWAVATLNVE